LPNDKSPNANLPNDKSPNNKSPKCQIAQQQVAQYGNSPSATKRIPKILGLFDLT
jgi:hypothetical protein